MDIEETTPLQVRTFDISVTETELLEIRIAFDYMLEISPQWYTNTQHEKVKVMRDKIRAMLGGR